MEKYFNAIEVHKNGIIMSVRALITLLGGEILDFLIERGKLITSSIMKI